ncbi:LuxR C-terminal-related transcriptional regulator [Saccharothrix isguenensis]
MARHRGQEQARTHVDRANQVARDLLADVRELRERGIEVPVLVLTTFDDDSLVLDALHAGARGYLLKDVTFEQLTRAVHTLAGGGTLIAPSVTDRLLRAIRSGLSPVATGAVPVKDLTEREREVLRLVAEGYNNREISAALLLAEVTVKNHVSTILLELGARDRTNAVLRALHEGILLRRSTGRAACRSGGRPAGVPARDPVRPRAELLHGRRGLGRCRCGGDRAAPGSR